MDIKQVRNCSYDSFGMEGMLRNMPRATNKPELPKIVWIDGGDDEHFDMSSDKCPICLVPEIGQKNRAFACNCLHKFCFECLLEWSRIRAACPICKAPFDRILYECAPPTSRCTLVDFKEHHVKSPPSSSSDGDDQDEEVQIVGSKSDEETSVELSQRQMEQRATVSKASWIAGKQRAPALFRALVYANGWYSSPTLSQTYVTPRCGESSSSSEPLIAIHYSRWTRRPAHDLYYQQRLWLMQWLMRELTALAYTDGGAHRRLSSAEIRAFLVDLSRRQLEQPRDTDLHKWLVRAVTDFVSARLRRSRDVVKHVAHELHVFMSFLPILEGDLADFDARVVYYSEKPRKSGFLLPVNLDAFRLHPDARDGFLMLHEESEYEADDEDGGIDLAKHWSDAGASKSGYVSRILQDTHHADKRPHSSDAEELDECSMRATLFSSDDDDDDGISVSSEDSSSDWRPDTPPPSPRDALERSRVSARHRHLLSHHLHGKKIKS